MTVWWYTSSLYKDTDVRITLGGGAGQFTMMTEFVAVELYG